MSSKVTLLKYIHDPKEKTWSSTYLVSHTSSTKLTTLEQKITFDETAFGASIQAIELDGFPTGMGEQEAMLKLADWLHRMSVAIEDHWVD